MTNTDGITMYHNPRCSKSRKTLELLRESGIEPEIVQYLSDTPDQKEMENILNLLGMEPRDLMRRQETEYREAGLGNPDLSRAELIEAMCKYPRLIERPIVVKGTTAILGRPPENVLALIK
jgi:arsenate reductase